MKLRPYQRQGVDFILSRKASYLSDEPGLGKTIQALTAWKESVEPKLLVVCPASIKEQWKRCIENLSACQVEAVYGITTKFNAHATIINYELITQKKSNKYLVFHALQKVGFDFVIIDEAHYLKNPQASRTRLILGRHSFLAHAKKIVLLSGTPLLNRPNELYTILKTFLPEKLGSYNTWLSYGLRFCGGFYTPFGWNMNGASNIGELSEMLEGFVLRRTKQQVLTELPPVITDLVYFNVPGLTISEKDTLLPTLRQEVAKHRLLESVKWIHNKLQTIEKLTIFCYHRDIIKRLTEELKQYEPSVVMGGISASSRQDEISSFIQESKKRVFIGQIAASGQGIDGLQHICSNVVFFEIDWSPGVLTQAIDRLHRIGQQEPVTAYFLVQKGTIEERIKNLVQIKEETIKQIIKEEDTNMSSLNTVLTSLEALQLGVQELPALIEGFRSAFEEFHSLTTKDILPEKKPRGKTSANVTLGTSTSSVSSAESDHGLVSDPPSSVTPVTPTLAPSIKLALPDIKAVVNAFVKSSEEYGLDKSQVVAWVRTHVLDNHKDTSTVPEALYGSIHHIMTEDKLATFNKLESDLTGNNAGDL